MLVKSRKPLAILVFLIYLGWGFFQERLKIACNFYIEQSSQIPNFYNQSAEWRASALEQIRLSVNAHHDYYWSHKPITFFNQLSLSQMKMFKAGIAVFFILLSFFVTCLVLRLWFGKITISKWIIWTYGSILVLILFCVALGYISSMNTSIYAVSRELLGIIQSPLPIIILGLLFSFFAKAEVQSNKFVP